MTNRRPHKKTNRTVGGRGAAIGGDVSDSAIITGDHNVVQISAPVDPVATALHQVPPPPADFTGRKDEIEELLAAIGQGGVTISGLQGLGGIGKTALALKLVEQLKPSYPDAQFYLDLKGASNQPLTVAEALAHVVRAYHPAAKLPENETELRGLYLSVLDGQRALLLMDNAASAEQVGPLIPPVGCVLLVTSRWYLDIPGFAAKNLDALSIGDARTLLLAIAPRIGTWADEIAKQCGYLPLALRLAGGALKKYRNLKPADYARRLRGTQQRVQLIQASLSLSYELLSEELRERWRWLAVFPDSFADDAAAAVWEVGVDQAQHTLGELIAASMVEWNETTDRYRLHDLVRLFADTNLSAEERAAGQKSHATHYKDVLSTADDLYMDGGKAQVRGLALFDVEWNNIRVGHGWVEMNRNEADEDVARLGIAYTYEGTYILYLRQHPRERIRWLEITLAAAKRLKHRADEGNALGNLGNAYKDVGDTQRAIQFYEQTLLILRELGDRRREGSVLNNLGNVFRELGETQHAMQFYEQALLIVRELGDRRGEGNLLNNLSLAYDGLGEIQRAIQLYEQALLIFQKLGDRQGEGTVLGNLGIAYKNLGDIKRAIQFYKRCLTIARELRDRRGEGIALFNMSQALDRLGNRTEAILYAEQSLTIFEQVENPGAAIVRAQLDAWRLESRPGLTYGPDTTMSSGVLGLPSGPRERRE